MFWIVIAWTLAFLIHWTILYCVSVKDFTVEEGCHDYEIKAKKENVSSHNKTI